MTVEGQEIKAAIRDLDTRFTQQIGGVRKEIDELRKEVAEASRFQEGFQSVTRTLTYILGIVVVAATVYGAVFR